MKCHPNFNEEQKSQLLEEKSNNENPIPQDMLKKYILYAKRVVHPKIQADDREKIAQFYTDLRKESSLVGGLAIGVRHIESILRMAEASAKMHLRNQVSKFDVDVGISMMLNSFLMSQKYTVAKSIEKKFAKYLLRIDGPNNLLINALDRLVQGKIVYLQQIKQEYGYTDLIITKTEFEAETKQYEVANYVRFYKSREFNSKYYLEGTVIKPKS